MLKTLSVMTAICLLTLSLAPQALAEDEHPLVMDATGVAWEIDFEQALARAGADARLLMIKPVAFGTRPDGGW